MNKTPEQQAGMDSLESNGYVFSMAWNGMALYSHPSRSDDPYRPVKMAGVDAEGRVLEVLSR